MSTISKDYYKVYINDVLTSQRDKMDSLLKTKRLIFSNDKYIEYRTNYYNMFHSPRFKQPREVYPIKIRGNISSIKTKQSSVDAIAKKSVNLDLKNEKQKIYNSLKIKLKTIFNKTESLYPLLQTKNNKSQINAKRNCLTEIKEKNETEKQSEIKYLFTEENINKKKTKVNSKDILLSLLLGDEIENYCDLIYDESIIFNDIEYYNDLMIGKLNELKKYGVKPTYKENIKIKNFGQNKNFYQTQNFNIFHTISNMENSPRYNFTPSSVLKLTSFKINFEDVNDKNNKFEFILPFELVPLFYYENMKNIQLLLVGLFKYENNKFNLKLEEIKNMLKNSKYFDIPNLLITKKDKILRRKRNQLIKKHTPKKLIFSNIDTYNYPISYRRFSFSINKISSLKPKCIYKEKWNIMELFWLTSDDKKFKLTVKIPEIEFQIENFTLRKNMNIELMLLLLEDDFGDWEFFVLKYLLSFKVFRNTIQMYFSKKNYGYIHFLNLSQKCIFPIFKGIKQNSNDGNKVIIYLSIIKKINTGIRSTNFFFIYSDTYSNYYKILHNYDLKIHNKTINPQNNFNFHFNYEQMKNIFSISKRQNLCQFFAKILENDTQQMKIKLNYDLLNNFNKTENNCIAIKNPTKTAEHICAIIGKRKGGHKISINQPILETIKYIPENSDNFNGECFVSNIHRFDLEGLSLKILEKICKCDDTDGWPEILILDQKNNSGDIGFKNSTNNIDLYLKDKKRSKGSMKQPKMKIKTFMRSNTIKNGSFNINLVKRFKLA